MTLQRTDVIEATKNLFQDRQLTTIFSLRVKAMNY
jgi:hypothetical protein